MIHLGIYRVNQITAKSIYLTFYVTHSSCLWLYAPPPTTLLIPLPLANSASCSLFGSAHFLCAGLAARSGRAAGIGAFYHPPLSGHFWEKVPYWPENSELSNLLTNRLPEKDNRRYSTTPATRRTKKEKQMKIIFCFTGRGIKHHKRWGMLLLGSRGNEYLP